MNQLPERFTEKYVPEPMSGCWLWTGAINSNGYGSFFNSERKKTLGAHRFAFETTKGAVPEGLQLDHLCRNRSCVNPAHLEVVTPGENSRRSPLIGRARNTHCLRGHAFDEWNTAIRPNGARRCRACDARRHREKYQPRPRVFVDVA